MVVFKAMVKEWKLELDNYYMENYIRENINQVFLAETLNDAFLLFMEAKSMVQDNTIEDSCSKDRRLSGYDRITSSDRMFAEHE